jgi:WD40 repeat protein
MTTAARNEIRVFVSYAREDKRWLDPKDKYNLIPFLTDSLRRSNVAFWTDRDLRVGDEYKKQIDAQIEESQIAILIVSQDFLNSRFIEDREMPRVIQRANEGKLLVVPVLVGKCLLDDYPLLADRHMVPSLTPLIKIIESDSKWSEVRIEILEHLKAQVNRIRTGSGWPASTNQLQSAQRSKASDSRKLPQTTRLIVAAAGYEKTARIWDLSTGEELAACKGHDRLIWSVAISPDGARIATTSDDRTARIWDIATGASSVICKGHSAGIRSVAFSPDGERLATASDDHTVKVWDATTGLLLPNCMNHEEGVWSVTFNFDGSKMATSSADSTARIWDSSTDKELMRFEGHNETVRSVVFSPNGTLLATAGDDKTARIWDAATGRQMVICKGHEHAIHSVAFSPNGNRIATGGLESTVNIWDVSTGALIAQCKEHHAGKWAWSVAFSPDGKWIATAGRGQSVKIWDSETGREWRAVGGGEDVEDHLCVAFGSLRNACPEV